MGPELIVLVLAACLAGSALGTLTGLIPGIHVNTLASIMLVSYPAIASFISTFADPAYVPIVVSACIMSASVVHSFVAYVPAVFVGAPDPDEVLTVLPGHRLLMQGQGMRAIRASAIGSAVGAASAIILAIPIQYLMLHGLADKLDLMTVAILMFTVSAIILKEKGIKTKMWAAALVFVSGALGLICMDLPIQSMGIVGEGTLLFPLLTGLFGMPALISSFKNASVPLQEDSGEPPVDHIPGIKGVLMGAIAGWYPGITATAGASLSAVFMPEEKPERFIAVVSSISTVTAIFALVTLSVSGKGRTGTVLVIRDIVGDSISGFCSPEFLLLLLSAAVASFLGYHLMIGAGKIMSRMTDKIDTRKLSKIVVCFIVVLVLLLTGPFGLLILVISLLIGLIPLGMEISRIPLAGCLMIPVLVHNLFGPLF